ncbi:thioesterase II family protein [Streptomyces sp. NBC_00690]|uniref:thioesterase II family protein n=1 Tax=Streptomyces sp. NBC_00690 TaxID=2975808 RepID=UPI002E297B4F|nr:alpha/beta fold hydrolase [Streptomyces sp. NBC_00690]
MTLESPARKAPPESWVLRPQPGTAPLGVPGPPPAVRLVCFPYAGGSAAVYHGWSQELRPAIEPWPLRLPGREARHHEPLRTDLLATACEAAAALASLLAPPYAFFGHSLGAFLAFETARLLRDEWGTEPSLLAVSARNAPQHLTDRGELRLLPDDEYIEVLDRRYGAIPPLIRRDPRMRELYLPILRADTTTLETYEYQVGKPLSCPILAFGGTEDPETSQVSLSSWGEMTSAGCTTSLLPGGHFFLQEQRHRLLGQLRRELLAALVP